MARTQLKARTAKGITFTPELDTSDGLFYAELEDGQEFKASSLAALTARVGKAADTVRPKVSVPVLHRVTGGRHSDDPPPFHPATITGIHARDRLKVLFCDEAGQPHQERVWGESPFFKPDADVAEHDRLWRAVTEARRAQMEWIDANRIDAAGAVAKAQAETKA